MPKWQSPPTLKQTAGSRPCRLTRQAKGAAGHAECFLSILHAESQPLTKRSCADLACCMSAAPDLLGSALLHSCGLALPCSLPSR